METGDVFISCLHDQFCLFFWLLTFGGSRANRLIELCTAFFNVTSATVERFSFQYINVNSIILYQQVIKGIRIRKCRQLIQRIFR
jgi:hypothetical protein